MNGKPPSERASPGPQAGECECIGIAALFLASDSRRARPCCELRDATGWEKDRSPRKKERIPDFFFFVQVRTRRRRAKQRSLRKTLTSQNGAVAGAPSSPRHFAARTAPPAPGATPIGGVLCEREVQRLPPRVWRQLRPGRRAGRCGHRAHLGAAAARSPAARRTPYRVPYASAPPLRRRSLT